MNTYVICDPRLDGSPPVLIVLTAHGVDLEQLHKAWEVDFLTNLLGWEVHPQHLGPVQCNLCRTAGLEVTEHCEEDKFVDEYGREDIGYVSDTFSAFLNYLRVSYVTLPFTTAFAGFEET